MNRQPMMLALFLVMVMVMALAGLTGLQANAAQKSAKKTPKSTAKSTAAKPKAPTPVVTKSTKVAADAEDPHIKQGRVNNSLNSTKEAPAARGGKKTLRGADGKIMIENYTGYYIDIYIDGIWQGIMGPYGDLNFYAEPGSYELYGRAEFDDGDAFVWGPKDVRISSGGRFTWQLKR